MYFVALATDYDGTLAHDGAIDEPTLQAMRDLKASGRRLLLVTGREMPDLERVCPHLDLFDLVIAENGALLYEPATKKDVLLAPTPPPAFIDRLNRAGVSPLSVGRSIVATWEPHETLVLETIRDLGLELHIIFNKGAVMVLPANVNKATGLAAALERLGLSPHNVVGVGDAENDHAFLMACGCAVAVDNALPAVKAKADFVTRGARGDGVIELARLMIETDLRAPGLFTPRASPMLGQDADGKPVLLSPFAETALVAGSSGGGKTTAVLGLMEKVRELDLQFCIIDPEGDYSELAGAVAVGGPKQPPRLKEIMTLLARPDVNVSVNLLGIEAADRPRFFARLLPELIKLRAATGRPHWLVIDEAHHMLPAQWQPAPLTLPREMPATILVTVHPEELSPELLGMVQTVIGVGDEPQTAINKFLDARGAGDEQRRPGQPSEGHGYLWHKGELREIVLNKPKGERKRHARKYAEGELGEDKSFYFRGPKDALNLRAQNLGVFLQMAAGVDDDTWLHHLRANDYSRWFRDAIKDDDLADETEGVEEQDELTPATSRDQIRQIVEKRYTAPAKTG